MKMYCRWFIVKKVSQIIYIANTLYMTYYENKFLIIYNDNAL